jgi:hypothetical protein
VDASMGKLVVLLPLAFMKEARSQDIRRKQGFLAVFLAAFVFW